MNLLAWIVFGVVALIIAISVIKRWDALKVFFAEVRQETGKVAWPSKPEVINSTVLVGMTVIILTIGTGLVDLVLSKVLRLIY